MAGAVQAREVQARQERRGRRERHSSRQDKGLDALKQARQSGAGTAGAKATARKSMATSRLQAGTHDGPDRSRNSAGHAFWTWLVPALGVLAGMLALLAVLLAACFLL